ncbi:MAG: IS630 family transposase, partial [Proteobacteria bacterium]|nr:IS630 family transposase [Pseudomonadota bacterium]
KTQCLERRIGDREVLCRELAAWERTRNRQGARIEWLFTVDKARKKLGRVYPVPTQTQHLAA